MPPVPKRSDQRRRRNSVKPDKAASFACTPPDAPRHWQPMVVDFFEGVKGSGQAVFYEASDWQMLILALEVYNDYLISRQAAKMREFNALVGGLLLTEGDRRRAHLELEKPTEDDGRPKASELAKRRLGVAG